MKGKKSVRDIKVGDVINDEEILVEMFNNHSVSITENSTGVAPIELVTPLDRNLESRYSWKCLETLWKSSEYNRN